MAQLVSIIETPEAITAEGIALVWEAYDAPRKRVPRARIVEHPFTVSIPKVSEDAAPVAFIIERFPEMSINGKEYLPGYDQPIRYAGGKFFTPTRFNIRRRWRKPSEVSEWESSDPITRITAHVESMRAVHPRDRDEYAESIARDEMRADKWPVTCGHTVEDIDNEAAHMFNNLIVIGGELWETCEEPVYEYNRPYTWGWNRKTDPAYISVTTDPRSACANVYGALDYIELNFYHAGVNRIAYIDVKRPDLVSVDRTARDLAEDSDRAARDLEKARERLEDLQEQLASARAALEDAAVKADRAREKCEQYETSPRAFWNARLERCENLEDGALFKASRSRRAAAARRELEKEA